MKKTAAKTRAVSSSGESRTSRLEAKLQAQKELTDTLEQIVRTLHADLARLKKEHAELQEQMPAIRMNAARARDMGQAMLELNGKLEQLSAVVYAMKQEFSGMAAAGAKGAQAESGAEDAVASLRAENAKMQEDLGRLAQRVEILQKLADGDNGGKTKQ